MSPQLTDSELNVLDSLPEQPQVLSQRELSRHTGLSLGLINAILKKLVKTGYVKTLQLSPRTVQYMLTPQGCSEKMRKVYEYTLRTVQQYRRMQMRMQETVTALRSEGCTDYFVHGDGELAEMMVCLLQELGCAPVARGLPASAGAHVVVLNAQPQPLQLEGLRCVEISHVMEERA